MPRQPHLRAQTSDSSDSGSSTSHILPLRVDGEASVVIGGDIVVDANNNLVAECDTADEAIAMVAAANGTTEDDVLLGVKVQAQYLDNVRRGRKPSD